MKNFPIILITGGSRSGKSLLARQKALPYPRRIFLATAVVTDSEMASRISKHQEERGSEFVTVEEPLYLAQALRSYASQTDVILVDCLTFWLNNLFHHWGGQPDRISKEIEDFLQVLEEKPVPIILVTNEINMGVIAPDPATRRFVDQQASLNQEAARRADEVVLMISGFPQILKRMSQTEPGAIRRVEPPAQKPVPAEFEICLERIQAIPPLDFLWREKARKRLAEQTRPEGSLGELERYLERIVAIEEKEKPSVAKKRMVIFAADHGIEAEGVSLYPREVTPAMVYNFISGGATINAFAKAVGAEVEVVDVGVDHEFEENSPLISRKIRRSTFNFKKAQAMSSGELLRALEIGWERAREAKEAGVELLGVGEMGIGNTTAASAVIAALTGASSQLLTGRGTGINDQMLEHKIQVIEDSLRTHQKFLTDPFSILQTVGGFEIAAITGFIIAAASFRIPCVVDGWIASAGAFAAIRLNPSLLDYLFFAHESEEKGHRILLEELDVKPMLRLSMRLGEGTGACLAMGILEAAVRAYNEVATFEEAKVAGKKV